jgi:hypothetical protein
MLRRLVGAFCFATGQPLDRLMSAAVMPYGMSQNRRNGEFPEQTLRHGFLFDTDRIRVVSFA